MTRLPLTLDQRDEALRIALAGHQGLDQAISAPALAEETGIPERAIRQLLARQLTEPTWTGDGTDLFIVVAAPGRGYFLAADLEEVYAYRSWLSRLVATAKSKLQSFEARCADLGIALDDKPARKGGVSNPAGIVAQALAKQQAEGLSDYALCKRVGINPGTWSRIRRGTYAGQVPTRVAAKLNSYLS